MGRVKTTSRISHEQAGNKSVKGVTRKGGRQRGWLRVAPGRGMPLASETWNWGRASVEHLNKEIATGMRRATKPASSGGTLCQIDC